MRSPFIEFCAKVGIVAGASAGVLLLLNMGAGFAWSVATRPIMDAIAAEARAREAADKDLTHHLAVLLRDRLDLLDVMMTPAGSMRDRKLAETRTRWERR